MTMNPVRKTGYFGRDVGPVPFAPFMRTTIPTDPAPPGQVINWTAEIGPTSTQATISIRAPFPIAGDAAYWGDGDGTITDVVLMADGVAVDNLGPVQGSEEVIGDLQGILGGDVDLTLVVVGTAGAGLASDPITVTVATTTSVVGLAIVGLAIVAPSVVVPPDPDPDPDPDPEGGPVVFSDEFSEAFE